jgi:hypothetical protein
VSGLGTFYVYITIDLKGTPIYVWYMSGRGVGCHSFRHMCDGIESHELKAVALPGATSNNGPAGQGQWMVRAIVVMRNGLVQYLYI